MCFYLQIDNCIYCNILHIFLIFSKSLQDGLPMTPPEQYRSVAGVEWWQSDAEFFST